MTAAQPEPQHGVAQQQAISSVKAPLHMSTIAWSVTKAALLGTVLGLIGLLPIAAVAYAGWLHCPKLLLAAELAAEAGFAVYYFCVIAKQLNAIPNQHDPPADYNPQQLVASFLQHMARVDDIKGYLSQWFLDAPFEYIRHDNVKELVAFAIFFKTPEQVQQQGLMPQLDALLEQLSNMHNLQLPPGYNPNLKFMSHLWGETPHMYRPLFFYVVMEFIELLCWAILACCGFKRYSILGCTYYTYGLPEPQQQQQQAKLSQPHHNGQQQQPSCRDTSTHQTAAAAAAACAGTAANSVSAARVPLLVLHGVGAGLLPYLGVALNLAAAGQPMLLPVWKQVSMRLMRSIPTVDDSVDVVLALLQRHGFERAAVLGHSYGSLVAARLVRVAPKVVHTLAVVDPVCFAMHMPNLVKYFLYSAHISGNWVADAFIALLRSEIHCARNFTRNFFWATINLFDEHLPERTLVVLSGTDLLCPTHYVREWLEGHTSATVLYHATASHGAGLLLHLPWQCTVLNSVLSIMGQPGEAGSAAAAAAVAETAAAGPDKAALVTAGHGAANEAVGCELSAVEGDALCCVAAADARVLAEAGCWSDSDEDEADDEDSDVDAADVPGSSCRNAAAAAAAGAVDEASSWGGSRWGFLLRSLTGLPSESESGTASSDTDSDSEDLSGFDVTDWGSSDGEVRESSKEVKRSAVVDANAVAGQSGSGSSSREGDGLWGLCGGLLPGLGFGSDEGVDLELLREAASSFVAATCQVAAVSAGSLVGALKGSAGSLQQLQRAARDGLGQDEIVLGQDEAAAMAPDFKRQQKQGGRKGLVRRAGSCGADAVRSELQQRDGRVRV